MPPTDEWTHVAAYTPGPNLPHHSHSAVAFDGRPKWATRYPDREPLTTSTWLRRAFYDFAFPRDRNIRFPMTRPTAPTGDPHHSLFLHLYNWTCTGDYTINVSLDDLGERIIRLSSNPTDHIAASQNAPS